jgi:hypothetical protein
VASKEEVRGFKINNEEEHYEKDHFYIIAFDRVYCRNSLWESNFK